MTETSTGAGNESGAGDEYGTYSIDEEDQLPAEDTLGDGDSGAGSDVEDELDRGYNPPEGWSAAQGFGNTPYEEAVGETLEQRLAQEVPDVHETAGPSPEELDEQAAVISVGAEGSEGSEVLDDGEVGAERAGRLVAPDEGLTEDVEKDLVGTDVGIDGAAASAEEAAVHIIPDDGDENTF